MFDTGATRHLTPYRSDFSTYIALKAPIYFSAANRQHFVAVGVGKLAIQTPNGATESTLTLPDIYHAPSVGYTLISVGRLDAQGFKLTIEDGHLELFDLSWNRVACVARTDCKLYWVTHEGESANIVETILLMELHCHMGHIAPES